MRTSEIQGKLWGTFAESWADHGEATSNDLFKTVLAKIIHSGRGKKLLDAGCGAGGFCKMAYDEGFDVRGFDASEPLIKIARNRMPRTEFLTGDLEELPYNDNTFDTVTGFNSYQYAGDIVNALKEAKRVTKKHGKVIITVWGKPEDCDATQIFSALAQIMPPPQNPTGRPPLYNNGSLDNFASEAGLAPVKNEDIVCLWKFENESSALKAILSAGLIAIAINNAGEEKVRETVRNAVAQFKGHAGNYILKNSFKCLEAEA